MKRFLPLLLCLLACAASAQNVGGGIDNPSDTPAGVTTFSGGTTGFTPNSATTGAVTLAGTLVAGNGGTGITSLGTGVPTALGVNVGTAGSFIVNGGALGTPSGGTLTNATGLPAAGVVGTAAILGANTYTGLQTFVALAETYTAPAISSNVLTINLALGTVFNVANNANITTFTISNAPAGKATSFQLFLTANGSGFTQAWGASVVWQNGSAAAPTLTTTNGKRDRLLFTTNDGGTTWFADVIGQNY